MTSIWDTYPTTYREAEIARLLTALNGGESAAVIGLSGSGKSNLMGFLAHRVADGPRKILIDCNRLAGRDGGSLLRLMTAGLDPLAEADASLPALENQLRNILRSPDDKLCFLIDRFEALEDQVYTVGQNLRALRDAYKYQLVYVIASRRPVPDDSELSELLFANQLWLGPLSREDAQWSARQFAKRRHLDWDETALNQLVEISGKYPSFLRAACEACASGVTLELPELLSHPVVERRLAEFWSDAPTPEQISASQLAGHPWLTATAPLQISAAELTSKEQALLDYLRTHANQVCEKNDLIAAVWPEDQIYGDGLRDESLAQLVRRLRLKIEPDPAAPRYVQTVPGRGYIFAS
ncbi:MAG: winged helix-turn-helix domain-containing protein [Anaerolineales bacterium]|jgi:hypothetical protein